MTVSLDHDAIVNSLVDELGAAVYFVLITSENGVVIKSYINEEFNKSSISLNISQLYETAEEITKDIGIQTPDFNIIHSANFYILSIKFLDIIIILLTEDQLEVSKVFQIINSSANTP